MCVHTLHACILITHVCTYYIHVEQFSNLDLNATRILGYMSAFFVREILDGIYPKPGGAHITLHAAPWGASDPKTCCNDNF